MPELKILNSKEIKEILKLIEKQWGAKPKLDYGFLENNKGIRLSIEGSQIIGSKAAKNIIELNEGETKLWFKGVDLEKDCKDCSGFVILKHKGDFLGTGKCTNNKILNYVGKTRRVNVI